MTHMYMYEMLCIEHAQSYGSHKGTLNIIVNMTTNCLTNCVLKIWVRNVYCFRNCGACKM